MWQRKVVGLRQHHCRTCGSAVCGSCCDNWTTYPPMGYETKVRICNDCNARMKDNPQNFNLTPLAISHEIRTGITAMHLQETLGLLATSGQNRVVMIWDVRNVCSASPSSASTSYQ
uniref:FYVE-type domain-containing protein n=1 Tax=Caenorhabditis japonica TaxID=281687 RepID=A0A8R1J0Z8_CAEJA